jgi:hypothetical protein
MFDPKNFHIVFIGYDKNIFQYRINLDILRDNFSFGKNLYITTVYTGDVTNFVSGIGENCFIKLENRGYAYGALDSINVGLSHANHCNRNLIALFNFDVLWYDEEKFVNEINRFLESEKPMAAAEDVNGLMATDCMFFRKDVNLKFDNIDILKGVLPIQDEHAEYRELLEIAERYKNTELGFKNVEEWLFNSVAKFINYEDYFEIVDVLDDNEKLDNLIKKIVFDDFCFKLNRHDLPRLHYSEELALAHEHDIEVIKKSLEKFNLNRGLFIEHLKKQ